MYGMGGQGFNRLFSQTSYLNRPDLLQTVSQGLFFTYNFSFDKALTTQKELLSATPDHPAPIFLEALIIYWKHFPLLPENPASDRFVDLMDQCVELSAALREQESDLPGGCVF